MSRSPTTAVVLAAGMGTRLLEGSALPKGFLRIGESSIVEESLARLVAHGIRRVVIVTGHHHERYDELAERIPWLLTTVHNPRFASTGSLDSLTCVRGLVDEDFLLLESDLVFERRALGALLEDPREDLLLVSGPTGAGDEVHVEAQDDVLCGMSKVRGDLCGDVIGELVGITKVSGALFAEILDVADELFDGGRRGAYETDGLVAASRRRPIHCRLVADLVWGEIDDARHLRRVREHVHPAIVARDGPEAGIPEIARGDPR